MNREDIKFEILKVDVERRIDGDINIEAVELSTRFCLKVKVKSNEFTNDNVKKLLLDEFDKTTAIEKDVQLKRSKIKIGSIL